MKTLSAIYRLINKDSKERKILKTIEQTGSLTQTAELLGLSYKTIWNYVIRINNAFGNRMVETKIGGEGGGGAYLTEAGRELLNLLDDLGRSLERFLTFIDAEEFDKETIKKFSKRYIVKTSARNQLVGKVVKIKKGMINALVEVETREGEILTATITMDSLETLGIEEGIEVYLLIKAPWVVIGVDDCLQLSARNVTSAVVKEVIKGAVNSEVILETEKGTQLISVVTNESVENLKLEPGKRVKAIFKASHVIVGV